MSDQMNVVNAFQPLIDKCAAFDAQKHDTIAYTKKMSFEPDGRLIVPSDYGSLSLGLEDTALCQLADRLGRYYWDASKRVIPTDFYRQLHSGFPHHFAGLTNELLQKADTKLLVRGYGDDVRAVLSDQYARLDNADLLDMASQVMADNKFSIVESGRYYSQNDGVGRDGMAVRIIVKNVQPPGESGPYGLGILIKNGETGGGASEVRPLVMRTQCMNSLVLSRGEDNEQLGLRLTHLGKKQSKVILLASAIAEALPMAQEGLEKFLETKSLEIDLAGVIAKLGQDQGWGEETSLTVAQGSEGSNTIFGLINGLTFAAHELELSMTDRFKMESLATEYIYRPSLAKV